MRPSKFEWLRSYTEGLERLDDTQNEETAKLAAWCGAQKYLLMPRFDTYCMLIRRDGTESAIEDSAAPIHDRLGAVIGAVTVFHDVRVARAVTLNIRWRHSQLGIVPAGRFVGIAQQCGLIVPNDQWALREACRQGRAWQMAGLPLRVAVNICSAELRTPDFVSGVREILNGTDLGPRYLELELAETALIEDSRSVSDILKELRDIGVLLALEDFSSSSSSLSHLKCFSIDTLKKDRSVLRARTGYG